MSKSPVDLTSRSASRPTSASRPPRSSTSPVKPPSRTAALNLGSPVVSPAKPPILSQASRNTVSPTRNESTAMASEGKSRLASVVVADEKEVIDLVDPPTAGDVDGDVDVEMNGDETVEEEPEDGEEDEGEGEEGDVEEGEGEGEGEGSGSDEEEDDEEEEDDDEDDDEEDSGDESEDLGGSPEIVAIDGPNGPPRLSLPPTVKTEPGDEGAAPAGPDETALAEAGAVTAEGEVNMLAPKKKKRVRPRSPSEDVDLPPPPPPMKTIRLESKMLPDGETLEWDILEDARAHGMVAEIWAVAEDDVPIKNGEDGAGVGVQIDGQGSEAEINGLSNGPGPAGPSSGPLFGLGFGDEDPEEIARRLEEKYGEDNRKSKKAKSKKKKPIDYDLNDPFIDDSEIMIDAPTHYARPKKEGFFVHSGMLELMEESPVKAKPRTTKAKARTSNAVPAPPKPPRRSLSAVVLSNKRRKSGFKGSEAEPISIDDSDGDTKTAGPSKSLSRKSGSPSPPREGDEEEKEEEELNLQPVEIDRVLYKSSSKDPALLPPYLSFPAAVRRRLNALRAESEKHDWNHGVRGKFPEHLRKYLQEAGQAAFEHDLFGLNDREGVDKSFFLALPSALPYNEFTLRKLVTKLCYPGYWLWLQECEEEGIRQFKEMVEQQKDEILAKYEEAHKAWEIDVEEWDGKHPNAVGTANAPTSAEPMAIDTLINGPSSGLVAGAATPKLDDARPPEPPKRFPWTADMREVFGQLLENMSDYVDLARRAIEWNIQSARAGKEWGETATKIRLYKKINDAFPDGFMNTSIISREMTKLRGNKKKQQVDQDGGDVA